MEANNQNKRSSDDINTSKWVWRPIEQKKGSKCPSPRHLHSLVGYKDDLYLFGGFGSEGKHFGDFWKFETAKNRWTKLSKSSDVKPSPRHSHQAVVHKGKMCIFGGISNGETLGDLWSYDFANQEWLALRMTEKSNLYGSPQLSTPRWGHSMAMLGDKMVIFGGAGKDVEPTNDVIVIDWNSLNARILEVNAKDLPSPRQYASMVTYDNAIYLFGGFNGRESLNDLYRITLANDRVVCESLPVPSFIPKLRGASLSFLPHRSQLILFGGRTNQQLNSGHYSFSIVEPKWTEKMLVGPTPRYYHQSCALNGALFLFGGLGLSGDSDKPVNLNDWWTYSGGRTEDYVFVTSPNFNPDCIPLEVWNSILEYLAGDYGRNVASASIVSKQFSNIVKSSEILSKSIEAFTRSQSIFVKEILGNIIKIAVTGMGGSGKSASTVQFIQKYFVEEYDPTIEHSYRKLLNIDQIEYGVEVLDMAGPEEYPTMLKHAFAQSHGIYGVYSITDPESLKELRANLITCRSAKDGVKFPLIVCGNKSDLEANRRVSPEEGQALAREFGGLWIETSAKTGHNIDGAFIGLVKHIVDIYHAQNKRHAPRSNVNKKDRCLVM